MKELEKFIDELESNIFVEQQAPEPVEQELPYTAKVVSMPQRKVVSKNVEQQHYAFTRDPALLGYPPTLPIEIALNVAPISEILDIYDISTDAWQLIVNDPVFQQRLQDAKEKLRNDGMGFKMKAGLQAEELLRTSWAMIHADHTPATVKADLIKSTIKWAGYEPHPGNYTSEGGGGFSININFSGTPHGRVVASQ